MKVLDIFLAGELVGLNAVINANRGNKYSGARLKRSTDADIVTALQIARVKPLPNVPLVWTFIWQCKDRRRDPDNIGSAGKFVFDALQKAGVIENDGWGQIAEIHHYYEVTDPVGVRVMAHKRL